MRGAWKPAPVAPSASVALRARPRARTTRIFAFDPSIVSVHRSSKLSQISSKRGDASPPRGSLSHAGGATAAPVRRTTAPSAGL